MCSTRSITNNNVVIGFSGSNANSYIGAYYALHRGSDPAGTISTLLQYKEGVAPYGIGASGRQSWGDYSATVVDPTEPNVFWTIQEYAESSDGRPSLCRNCWGMQWARIVLP